MRPKGLVLAIFILLLLPVLALSAWDTRLLSLGSPTLSLTAAVPTGFGTVIFPTDEYGIGLSAIPDPLDIFTLPQQLANAALFPSSSVILDTTVLAVNPNGGVVLTASLGRQPLVLGLFLARPSLNGWVTGTPRSTFPGLGGSYFTDAGVALTAPTAPTNLVDLLAATRFGSLLVGAGLGFSLSQPANNTTSIVGTANSDTTDKSSSYVITGRLGASAPLGPVALDLSSLLMLGNESASRVSGAGAAIPNLNNSLNALDLTFSINGRATMPLAQTLGLVVLGEFALLPQDYSGSTGGTGLTNTTVLIDPSSYMSFGGGAGMNWKPSDAVFLNWLLSAIYGSGSWVNTVPGVTPRPTNTVSWIAFRLVLDGEFKLANWITLRGGLAGNLKWWGEAISANTGGTSSNSSVVENGIAATAGVGLQLTEKAALDVLLNLTNIDGTGGAIQVPGLSASMKVDL